MKNLFIAVCMLTTTLCAAQSGKISQQERDFLTNYFQTVKEKMANTLETITAEEWTTRRSDGGWSPAECMEHINKAVRAQLMQVKGTLSKEANVKDLSKYDGMLLSLMVDRGDKFLTPLKPEENGAISKEEMFRMFEAFEKEYMSVLNDKSLALRHHYGRTPFSEVPEGDGYQLMVLIAGHALRHTNQMLSVLEEMR